MMCWEEWQQDIEAREKLAVDCEPPISYWSIAAFCFIVTIPLWAVVVRDVFLPWWRSQ
jgi:hypothetical protein